MPAASDASTATAFPRLAEAFLEMLMAERGASGNTLAAYRQDIQHYQAFLAERGETVLAAGEESRPAVWENKAQLCHTFPCGLDNMIGQ